MRLLRELMENDNEMINLISEPFKVKSDDKGTGREYTITALEIHAQSYIPDIYVRMSDYNYDEFNSEQEEESEDGRIYYDGLEDDDTFISGIIDKLRELGYTGKPFGRAELGMQGRTYIVLEPGQEFNDWVEENYGWKYAGDYEESKTFLDHTLDAVIPALSPDANAEEIEAKTREFFADLEPEEQEHIDIDELVKAVLQKLGEE